MSVFRVEKNKGYTVMSNHHLRNHALSLKAKGLLSQMLSLPEDWDYTLQGLGIGSGFIRFRLFLQLVLGRCFCNRFGGFGFFQRAGDDVD